MKEVLIDKNENGQRLDRFLRKYLSKASKGFIYKMIRKKNIEVNNKRARPETLIYEGDTIQLYLSDETISKFMADVIEEKSKLTPQVIYEDSNILLINKPTGILSHSSSKEFKENAVDMILAYLIQKGDFDPKVKKTFTPSICNRLDRNTSGIIIGAKNYNALKIINEAIRDRQIKRFYKTIVKGRFDGELTAEGFLIKDQEENKVEIVEEDIASSKEVITNIKALKNRNGYSILEIELITGRTHQIRAHLSSIGYPIIGDRKYGNRALNSELQARYGLNNQFLHGYKLIFNGLKDELKYLNGRTFISELDGIYKEVEGKLFR